MTFPLRAAIFIPSLCYGGAERQVVEIARHVDPAKVNLHIILLIDYSPILAEDDPLHKRITILDRRSFFDFTILGRLTAVLRQERIQIIHSFLFLPELLARMAKLVLPELMVVGSERNSEYEFSRYRWILKRATRRLESYVIANSESGSRFNASSYGLPSTHYRVLYNGVDTCRFKPRDSVKAQREVGLEKPVFVIGMFASFKRQKNHLFLFKVLEELLCSGVELTLLLVGDSLVDDHSDTIEYKHEVRQFLDQSKLGSATLILGNRPDVDRIYPACHVTVLPSLHEGTPNVVIESMACGVPAIVTDVSDNSKLVTHGVDGYVIPTDGSFALRECLTNLITDAALRRTMGKSARNTISRRFSLEVMTRNAERIYFELSGLRT